MKCRREERKIVRMVLPCYAPLSRWRRARMCFATLYSIVSWQSQSFWKNRNEYFTPIEYYSSSLQFYHALANSCAHLQITWIDGVLKMNAILFWVGDKVILNVLTSYFKRLYEHGVKMCIDKKLERTGKRKRMRSREIETKNGSTDKDRMGITSAKMPILTRTMCIIEEKFTNMKCNLKKFQHARNIAIMQKKNTNHKPVRVKAYFEWLYAFVNNVSRCN